MTAPFCADSMLLTCPSIVYHVPYVMPCQNYTNIQSQGCALPPARPGPRHPHPHPHTLSRPPSLTPSPTRLAPMEQIVELSNYTPPKPPTGVTRPSCRKRNLRRLSHDTRQKGRKGVAEARACRGHSDGSREIPMVRTPADPLGSRTPSRGRSQRRDTGRGPLGRCAHASTHGSSSSKADARLSRLSRASTLRLTQTNFKRSRARSVWCRSRPLAPRTRGFESVCPRHDAPPCYLWEIQVTW